jgi:hypothetical protein
MVEEEGAVVLPLDLVVQEEEVLEQYLVQQHQEPQTLVEVAEVLITLEHLVLAVVE